MGPRRKIYLMTVAATGKSHFAAKHSEHSGFQVVDYARLMPQATPFVRALLYVGRRFPLIYRLAAKSEFVQAKQRDRYFNDIFAFLREQKQPTVVLGRPGPDDLSDYDDVTFGVVIVPWPQHQRNCEARRREMRNPIPGFGHWSTEPAKIKQLRDDLQHYAQTHGLPVFASFEQALDALIGAPSNKPATQSDGRASFEHGERPARAPQPRNSTRNPYYECSRP